MEPAAGKPTFWSAIRPVLGFGLCIFIIGLGLSLGGLLARRLLVLPWLDGLSWWKIFRRCVSVASALSLWFIVKKRMRRRLRSFGFSSPVAGRGQFRLGMLLGLSVVAVLVGILVLSGACRVEVMADRFRLWRVLLSFAPIAILIAILEELAFRGFILQHLLPYSRWIAVVLSSLLYALVHVKMTPLTLGTSRELIGLFLLGGTLALSFLQTQQLYFAVGLHAALAYGARINKLFVDFPYGSKAWLVGTSRLTDGLINWAVLVFLGGAILWWGQSLRSREVSDEGR